MPDMHGIPLHTISTCGIVCDNLIFKNYQFSNIFELFIRNGYIFLIFFTLISWESIHYVSDVIIVHTNCIEMSSFFIHTPKVGNYTKKQFGGGGGRGGILKILYLTYLLGGTLFYFILFFYFILLYLLK